MWDLPNAAYQIFFSLINFQQSHSQRQIPEDVAFDEV